MDNFTTDNHARCAVQAEQRTHDRYATNIAVEVYWQGPAGELHTEPGLIRDISRSGFGLELGQRLDKGQTLSVQTRVGALQCVVRHARVFGARYIVGLEVITASDGRDHARSLKNLRQVLDERRVLKNGA